MSIIDVDLEPHLIVINITEYFTYFKKEEVVVEGAVLVVVAVVGVEVVVVAGVEVFIDK
jgi:hypothetical protein